MNASLTPTLIKNTNREAGAITLLHAHKAEIFDALENSKSPLASFTLSELRDFLNEGDR